MSNDFLNNQRERARQWGDERGLTLTRRHCLLSVLGERCHPVGCACTLPWADHHYVYRDGRGAFVVTIQPYAGRADLAPALEWARENGVEAAIERGWWAPGTTLVVMRST